MKESIQRSQHFAANGISLAVNSVSSVLSNKVTTFAASACVSDLAGVSSASEMTTNQMNNQFRTRANTDELQDKPFCPPPKAPRLR